MDNFINDINKINDFLESEYRIKNNSIDNYRKIPLLYSTFDDVNGDEIDLQVDVNIIDKIIMFYNPYTDFIYETEKYDDIDDILSFEYLYRSYKVFYNEIYV